MHILPLTSVLTTTKIAQIMNVYQSASGLHFDVALSKLGEIGGTLTFVPIKRIAFSDSSRNKWMVLATTGVMLCGLALCGYYAFVDPTVTTKRKLKSQETQIMWDSSEVGVQTDALTYTEFIDVSIEHAIDCN